MITTRETAIPHTLLLASPWGTVSLLWFAGSSSLSEILLPGHAPVPGRGTVAIPGPIHDLAQALEAYFANGRSVFPAAALDWDRFAPFARRVYEHVFALPAGRTASYGQVAAACGSPQAARAVGNAMAHNPYPLVIPCHRVLAGGGGLGGYGGGLDLKRALLAHEGVPLRAKPASGRSAEKP